MTRAPLAAATVAGAVCLAASGWAGSIAAALTVVGFVGGSRLRLVQDWTGAHLAVLAGSGALLYFVDVVPAFALLLGWLAAHRAVVAEGRADERVLLLLGTLMALVGTVGALSLALAPALLLFAAAAPVALLHANGVHDRRLALGTSAGTLTLSLAFFVLVPRLQGGLLASSGEVGQDTDFADDVALGDESDDGDRGVLVMRVRTYARDGTRVHGPQYLRGRSMDHFDGTRWSVSGRVRVPSVGAWDTRAEVMLEPLLGTVVYGPPDLLYATSDLGPMLQGGQGELVHTQAGQRLAYETYSRSRALDEVGPATPELVQLPVLHPGVQALAASLAPGRTDAASIIAAATAALREGFTYTLEPDAPVGDPLAWFLLDAKAGHCEYYASALAVLLRARGVPVRLATGFYSDEYNGAADYLAVRRGHAHAWVEVAVRGGWVVVDATPTGALELPSVSWLQLAGEAANEAWLSLVLDYDLRTQFEAAARLGSAFVAPIPGDPVRDHTRRGAAGVGALLALLVLSGSFLRVTLWWLARPPRREDHSDPILTKFRSARARSVARGWDIPAELPPLEAGRWLIQEAGAAGSPLEELAQLLYRTRYAGEEVAGADVAAACKRARAIAVRRD